MTSEDSPNVTSFPEVASGQSQLDLLDGQTTGQSGPQVARANPSRKQGKQKNAGTAAEVSSPRASRGSSRALTAAKPMLLTQGTCGQTWIDLSAKPMLQGSDLVSLWGSRLAARLGQIGSTESPLIWRGKVTKSGRLMFRLAPWTPPTSAKGNTGSQSQQVWRTPNLRDHKGSYTDLEAFNRRVEAGRQINLNDEMSLTASWVTPSSRDWKDTAGMATERTDGRSRIDQLPRQMSAVWRTPISLTGRGGDTYTPEQVAHRVENGNSISVQEQMTATAAVWRTPISSNKGGGDTHTPDQITTMQERGQSIKLQDQMVLQATWATPTEHGNFSAAGGAKGCSPSAGDGICTQMVETAASGPTTNGSSAMTEKRGVPNPGFAMWLMGFPKEWIISAVKATCRKKPAKRSKRS
jgi:hypothetical protein